jgi:hypothetical protein
MFTGDTIITENMNNPAMAFALIDANIKSPPGNVLYSLWMHDQIYRSASSLYPNEGNKPEYVQLEFFDSAEAATKRTEVMQLLDEMLLQVNPFAGSYK